MNRNDFNSKIALQVEQERLALGYTQRKMAEALGVSLTAYKRIISGDVDKIDAFVLYKLFMISGCVCPVVDGDPLAGIVADLRDLSPRQLDFVRDVVKFEAGFGPSGTDSDLSVLVPTGCMEDGMMWDSANLEKVKAPRWEGVTCGVRVTSNHLHPVYVQGDVLLISQRPIKDGDTGIFIHKPSGRAYLRKFRQASPCMLEPVNGFGQVFSVDPGSRAEMDDWIKFGVVVSKLR